MTFLFPLLCLPYFLISLFSFSFLSTFFSVSFSFLWQWENSNLMRIIIPCASFIYIYIYTYTHYYWGHVDFKRVYNFTCILISISSLFTLLFIILLYFNFSLSLTSIHYFYNCPLHLFQLIALFHSIHTFSLFPFISFSLLLSPYSVFSLSFHLQFRLSSCLL